MRRSGVRIPSAPPNPLVRGPARILKQETGMASQHLVSTKSIDWLSSSVRLGRSRPGAAGLAHLVCMKTTAHSETRLSPFVTLSQLAAQLGVSVQTLYDLRSQGRGPRGSASAVSSGSGLARSMPGSRRWRPTTPSGTHARPADAHRKASHPDRYVRRDQHASRGRSYGGGNPRS